MAKKKVKNYIIHDTDGELPTVFVNGSSFSSLEEAVLFVLNKVVDEHQLLPDEAIDVFNESFIIYELGDSVNFDVESKVIVTIK